ncbi:hypothetical protein J6590_048009 [Homalodisca vitripennis]|nr:hypothetical protein J6590_048009 [Homalodisca vitripennis]
MKSIPMLISSRNLLNEFGGYGTLCRSPQHAARGGVGEAREGKEGEGEGAGGSAITQVSPQSSLPVSVPGQHSQRQSLRTTQYRYYRPCCVVVLWRVLLYCCWITAAVTHTDRGLLNSSSANKRKENNVIADMALISCGLWYWLPYLDATAVSPQPPVLVNAF